MTEPEMRSFLKERLKNIKADDLTTIVKEVMAMPHDYGTVCVAIGALAAATARACDREPNGGITGFQAGVVFWEFTRAWGVFGDDAPKRMVQYENMLYPQYAGKFASTITPDTWKWLQERAKNLLAEKSEYQAVAVTNHLQSIVDGVVPFGYVVKED